MNVDVNMNVNVDVSESVAFLEDTWILYFHDPDNNSWTKESYKNIASISTPEEWVTTFKSFETLWANGMFFIMREHILPIWEDPSNKEGGCFSFKVNKTEVPDFWFTSISKLLGNTLGKNDDISDNINGISISCKRNYCIVRIWIKNSEASITNYNLDIPNYTQVLYKTHLSNCDFDAQK